MPTSQSSILFYSKGVQTHSRATVALATFATSGQMNVAYSGSRRTTALATFATAGELRVQFSRATVASANFITTGQLTVTGLSGVGIRALTSDFRTEKNKLATKPLWVLVVRFATGTLYLSDDVVTITGWPLEGSPTTKAWIARWGEVDDVVATEQGAATVSDFTCTIIDDQADANRWSVLVEDASNKPALTPCELYLWFTPLTAASDPPVKVWQGTINDPGDPDTDQSVITRFQDDIMGKLNAVMGVTVDKTNWPNAAPEAVGKQEPIIYGEQLGALGLAVDPGAHSTLAFDLPASGTGSTTAYTSDPTLTWPAVPFSAYLDLEEVRVTAKTTETIPVTTPSVTGVSYGKLTIARAQNGTTAVQHFMGATLIVKQAAKFLFTGHVSKQVLRPRMLDPRTGAEISLQSAEFTVNTNENGKTTVTLVKPKLILDRVDLLGASHSHGASGTTTTTTQNALGAFPITAASPAISFSPVTGTVVSQTVTLLFGVVSYTYGTGGTQNISQPTVSLPNIPPLPLMSYQQVTLTTTEPGNSVSFGGMIVGSTGGSWGGFQNTATLGSITVISASRTIQTVVGAGKTSSVTVPISGNNVARAVLALQMIADIQGYADDAVGTFTKTKNALITRPDHVFRHALYTYSARPLLNITVPDEFHTAEASYYLVAGVVDEKTRLKDFLQALAWQTRCYSYHSAGYSRLIWRPDTLTALKTLTHNNVRMDSSSKVTTLRRGRTLLEEVVNTIEIHYDLDPSGVAGYRGNYKPTPDAASVAKYGAREISNLALWDFHLVADLATVTDVAGYYLARLKDQHRTVEWESYLDQSELSFPARITLTHGLLYGGTITGELQKANLRPGSARSGEIDRLAFTLIGA